MNKGISFPDFRTVCAKARRHETVPDAQHAPARSSDYWVRSGELEEEIVSDEKHFTCLIYLVNNYMTYRVLWRKMMSDLISAADRMVYKTGRLMICCLSLWFKHFTSDFHRFGDLIIEAV